MKDAARRPQRLKQQKQKQKLLIGDLCLNLKMTMAQLGKTRGSTCNSPPMGGSMEAGRGVGLPLP
jgi:hypothetical protein